MKPVLDTTVRCKSLTAHDVTPPVQNARLQIGQDASQYMDLSLRGDLTGKIQPGKNYRIVIEKLDD